MRVMVVVVMLVGSGCTNVHVNRSALIASTVLLACDWAQTRTARAAGWVETNPIMGSSPSARGVNAYFASAIAVNAAVWLLVPDRYRSVLAGTVAGVQTKSVTVNAIEGAGVCGLGAPDAPPPFVREMHQQ